MKKQGLLNPDLCRAVARLGHLDTVVIADCGLPIPRDSTVVDLALVFGVPRFAEVLDALIAEIVVEQATIADEARGGAVEKIVRERVGTVTCVPHDDLKRASHEASLFVRTGEATPYANVILRCGVPF